MLNEVQDCSFSLAGVQERIGVAGYSLLELNMSYFLFPPLPSSSLGKISPWTGRFYSLLDPSYAKNNIPIIASVSEHQPTTWSSYYFDLQLLVFMFPGEPSPDVVRSRFIKSPYDAVRVLFCRP